MGPSRLRRRHIVYNAILSSLLVASAAIAAVTITYNTSSTITPSLKAPPMIWAGGPDSSGNNFVASFSLSSNATYYTITIKPVPEANVTFSNFTTLRNQASEAYTVTVTGTSVSSNTKILEMKMVFHNYVSDSVVATLDFRAGSPSASLGSVSASAYMYTVLFIKLDTGTNAADLPSSVTVSLTVAP
ncbi:MAG: hypothetical protein HY556_10125 [Euryarchaeota archaeon]|nr:hypothetical protein [Euryarchaeota archaeon]